MDRCGIGSRNVRRIRCQRRRRGSRSRCLCFGRRRWPAVHHTACYHQNYCHNQRSTDNVSRHTTSPFKPQILSLLFVSNLFSSSPTLSWVPNILLHPPLFVYLYRNFDPCVKASSNQNNIGFLCISSTNYRVVLLINN